MIKAQEHLSYKKRMVELGLFSLGKKKLGGAYRWEGRWRRWSQDLLSSIQCSDLFPRKAMETPSLEILKTKVDTVLDRLLWRCSEQRGQPRWSPEIPPNINRSVNVWFCDSVPNNLDSRCSSLLSVLQSPPKPCKASTDRLKLFLQWCKQ